MNLIKDEQRADLITAFAQYLQEFGRCGINAALTLNYFQDDTRRALRYGLLQGGNVIGMNELYAGQQREARR